MAVLILEKFHSKPERRRYDYTRALVYSRSILRTFSSVIYDVAIHALGLLDSMARREARLLSHICIDHSFPYAFPQLSISERIAVENIDPT